MSDSALKFGTMLNCMDGRTQEPVLAWMKENLGVQVVDAPNPAGPTNMVLNGKPEIVEHYKNEVLISINGHGSKNLVIIAHQDCAANPISDEEQLEQLKNAVAELVTNWGLPAGVRVTGLWLTKNTDTDWSIHHNIDKVVE